MTGELRAMWDQSQELLSAGLPGLSRIVADAIVAKAAGDLTAENRLADQYRQLWDATVGTDYPTAVVAGVLTAAYNRKHAEPLAHREPSWTCLGISKRPGWDWVRQS